MKLLKTILAASLVLSISLPVLSDENSVPYPDGYRSWDHVKSMIIQAGHPLAETDQGIHHIYANKEALEGLKSGHYSVGATFVYDLLEAVEEGKTIQEGERKLVGVMHKDTNKYSATGGWGFEGFAGNSNKERLIKDGGKACFSCHAPEKESYYIFSKLRK